MLTKCANCGKPIKGLPFKCPYCGKYFCSECRMPEVHRCEEFITSSAKKKKNFFLQINPSSSIVTKPDDITRQIYLRKEQINARSKRKIKKKIVAIILFIILGAVFYFLITSYLQNLEFNLEFPIFKKPNDSPEHFMVTTINSSSIALKWEKRFQNSTSYTVYTLIKRGEEKYPESISDADSIIVYNGTGNHTIDKNLKPGKIYYYRAWHFKKEKDKITYSNYYTQSFNVTKPLKPTSVIVQSIDSHRIRLIWRKGIGEQYTYIVRKEGSIPKNMTDGQIIWNSTGISCTDSSLESGKLYYYRLWSYVVINNITQWSRGSIYGGNLTKPEPPISFFSKSIDTSRVNLSWVKREENYITIVVRKKDSPPRNIGDGVEIYKGVGAFTQDKNLEAGQLYYYTAWHILKIGNFSQISYSSITTSSLTKPYAPTHFYAISYDNNEVKLYWEKGRGSDVTHIVRKVDSPPSSPEDGFVVYDGDGEVYYDKNLTKGTNYYYRAWSYVSCKGNIQYSANSVYSNVSPIAPTYNEILDFVKRDKTDEHEYTGSYVCHNFSVDVIKNADKEGIHAGYVFMDIPPSGHAIVAFNTSDKGLVFLEPQMDYLFTEQEMEKMIANKRYYIEKTWWEGNTEYIEKFDYPLYGYEIDWNYLEKYLIN